MNHKRRRPRSTRAGCKMCKPWKKNGLASRNSSDIRKWVLFEKWTDAKRRYTAAEFLEEYLTE